MFIRAYLRASTEEQNANRARASLDAFVEPYGQRIASYYVENQSGATLQRPELNRLLSDSQPNDVLLVEQIDRLTRLSNNDWSELKSQIQAKKLRIVSLDVPTSYLALDRGRVSNGDQVIEAILEAINNMLIDLMAAMARKDYESRQHRQRQGIEAAKKAGKYQGRPADKDRHQLVRYFREEKGLSLAETVMATGYSKSQVCRIQAEYRKQEQVEE
ncbi:recombinase family protein [Microbulbifer sp. DLAB2-AA]|uniref:recombinase family protein n=1 Tax=Microbulbifer sp. DLAB2-AA TaxID=3243394 RepID=UPI004039C4F1